MIFDNRKFLLSICTNFKHVHGNLNILDIYQDMNISSNHCPVKICSHDIELTT